jgi:arylsulfatase
MSIGDSMFAKDWWTFQFWRFVFVQQEVGKLAQTAIDFPPMQPSASFNLEAVKEKVAHALASRSGH